MIGFGAAARRAGGGTVCGVQTSSADGRVVAARDVVFAAADGRVGAIACGAGVVTSLIASATANRAIIVGDAVGSSDGPAAANRRGEHSIGYAVAAGTADNVWGARGRKD